MLQSFAATHNVKMVAVSIGGNDFKFADIVTTCVADFLASPTWWKDYCQDDSSVTANFTAANVAAVKARIATALQNVRTAMRNAGYSDGSWTMLVQTYPSPIPNGSGFRYAESGYTRQSIGGCGFWNSDANWANGTALPTINNTVTGAISQAGITNAKVLNLTVGAQRAPPVRDRRRPLRGGRARPHGRSRRRSTGPSGSTRSAPSRPAAPAAPTTSRRGCTRTTGRSWRSAAACGRPTTAVAARRHLHAVWQRAGQRRAGDEAVLRRREGRG